MVTKLELIQFKLLVIVYYWYRNKQYMEIIKLKKFI